MLSSKGTVTTVRLLGSGRAGADSDDEDDDDEEEEHDDVPAVTAAPFPVVAAAAASLPGAVGELSDWGEVE